MSEVLKPTKQFETGHRVRQALGLGAAGLLLGGTTGAIWFTHHEAHTEIAATEVGITPNFDGMVHIKPGAIPEMRMPTDSFIGIDVSVGNTTIPGDGMTSDITSRIAATYGGVATNPDAEIEQVREIVKKQAMTAGMIGGAVALLPTALYTLAGERRRQELTEKGAIAMGGVAVCLVAGIGTTITGETPQPTSDTWVPLSDVVSAASAISELDTMEIRSNAMTGLTRQLIAGAVKTYEKSKPFYQELERTAEDSSAEFRQPLEGEKVVFVISDRHDNIAMDPVLAASARAAHAEIVANLGDDTSSGKSWEAFSLRSFNKNFDDFTRIALGGNHDNGTFVIDYLADSGAITPNGEIQTVDGITIAMENDPRKSDYTPEKREGEIPYGVVANKLADLACSSDGGVDVVLVHSASMGQPALDRGCTDLVIGGHLHSYGAPEKVVGDDGHVGYTVTNGTSGGAFFSFALGTSLKREANALAVTFSDDGRPVGTQNVRYFPGGKMVVEDYMPLITRRNDIPLLPQVNVAQHAKQKGKTQDTPDKR